MVGGVTVRKIKAKKVIIAGVLIACLGLLEIIGTLPYLVARAASSIYITINYPTRNFKFDSAEYAYGFGDYSVRYKDKDGNTQDLGLMMFPKQFPIFVRHDSIKGGP